MMTCTNTLDCVLLQVIALAKDNFKEAVRNYDGDGVDKNIDLVQSFFKCCGVDGPQDYTQIPPKSCEMYITGCANAIENTIKSNSTLFAGVVIGAGALMVSSGAV